MNKACPVVTRIRNGQTELLVFKHPLAGNQLVKGTVEADEKLGSACERELLEESGLQATCGKYLGCWDAQFEGQVWGFYQMEVIGDLSERWVHFTQDGGGLEFEFFWHRLDGELGEEFHPLFKSAFQYLRQTLE